VKTPFAEGRIWLQIKPAHDGLLAMAMIAEIIAQNLCDTAFVNRWTVGFDDLSAVARRYGADRAASELGLPPEKVREGGQALRDAAARLHRERKRPGHAGAVHRSHAGRGELRAADRQSWISPAATSCRRKSQAATFSFWSALPAGVKPVTSRLRAFQHLSRHLGRQCSRA
jgi:anaerobic selenocysteine-containing dehydrogenase